MATATARRPQFRLLPPGPATVRDRNTRRVSAMHLGLIAGFIELRRDEAELAGEMQAMCDECPAQRPDCQKRCAENIIEWITEGAR
jgi:hypothetical protein